VAKLSPSAVWVFDVNALEVDVTEADLFGEDGEPGFNALGLDLTEAALLAEDVESMWKVRPGAFALPFGVIAGSISSSISSRNMSSGKNSGREPRGVVEHVEGVVAV